MGTVVLVDHEAGGQHYHAMHLYELAAATDDHLTHWWLFVHEHEAFVAAWA